MNILQKFKNFLWNDLPLRLSTIIVILVGIIPIIFCYSIIFNFILYKDATLHSNGLGLFLYLYFVMIIATIIIILLFIIECIFKKFRLNFKIFQSKLSKILILFFYSMSIISLYILPSMIWLFGRLR